jgi:CheY-like chemotaxis protein
MYQAVRLMSGIDDGVTTSGSGPRAAKPGNGAARKITLLVVEDEILIRMAAADHLRNNGFRVLEASTAAEALAVFAAGEPIQLVFTDVDMPGAMDGSALARWIRKYFPDVKVLLTAAPGAAHGATQGAVLEKPYSREALLASVTRLIVV